MVKSENTNSWEYFFTYLVTIIPEILEEETIFISDKDKGIALADHVLSDNILWIIYAYYLKDNFTTKFSHTLKPLFWSIIWANLKAWFTRLIEDLWKVNIEAVTYLLEA